MEAVESEGAAVKALTSLAAAVAADSWHPLDTFPGVDKASTGAAMCQHTQTHTHSMPVWLRPAMLYNL